MNAPVELPRRRRRARRPDLEEESDASRWVVSYADFITLLFAFFVVMYSISSVNDGKLRVLSESMEKSFKQPPPLPAPVDLGGGMPGRDRDGEAETAAAPLIEALAPVADGALIPVEDLMAEDSVDFAATVEKVLAEPVGSGQVRVRQSEDWTEIELDGGFLFSSGNARLAPDAEAVFKRLVPLLQATDTPVRVEGYTDNVPPRGGVHGSNWELSAARAASVAEAFAKAGVESARLSATGFGDLHPIATNATHDGRRKNRRVVIAVARHKQVPRASATLAAAADDASEALPPQALQRVSELPGAEGINL